MEGLGDPRRTLQGNKEIDRNLKGVSNESELGNYFYVLGKGIRSERVSSGCQKIMADNFESKGILFKD